MFFEIPRGATVEDLYKWAVETAEKLNREFDIIKEECKSGNNNTEA